MSIFNTIFGKSSAQDEIKSFIAKEATIIDVRTAAEFTGGHIENSINIPLQEIQGKADELKAINKPIIFCCASGGRSGQASSWAKGQGIECTNGGGWSQLKSLLES